MTRGQQVSREGLHHENDIDAWCSGICIRVDARLGALALGRGTPSGLPAEWSCFRFMEEEEDAPPCSLLETDMMIAA